MTSFGGYAHVYNAFYAQKDYTKEVEYVLGLVNKYSTVGGLDREGVSWVDAGCGTGNGTNKIAQLAPKLARIVGYDLSDDMISVANASSKLPTQEFVQGDFMTFTPENHETFDVMSALFHAWNYLGKDGLMVSVSAGSRPFSWS